MSSASTTFDSHADDAPYRAVNAGAIASVVLGLLSTLVFVAGRDDLLSCLMMCPIPILGLIVGVKAWLRIRSQRDQWSGERFALIGSAVSAACLVGGVAFASYVHATEVPPGYARTSFLDLKPDEVEQRSNVMIPADVAALDGKKVFIKGYLRPDSTPYRQNIRRFLLVRDNQQCCFGDISTVKPFDQIAVAMTGEQTVDYSAGVLRMAGTFHMDPRAVERGQPVFSLEADYAR